MKPQDSKSTNNRHVADKHVAELSKDRKGTKADDSKKKPLIRYLLMSVFVSFPLVTTGVYFLGRQNLPVLGIDSQISPESQKVNAELQAGFNKATIAVELGQSAKTKEQWRDVVKAWEQAIAQMKSVPEGSVAYNKAQEKVKEYQGYLKVAEGGLRSKLRKANSRMNLVRVIYGDINPKSIVHSGNGLFFAQNMMYNHTVTVYNRDFQLVKTIPDTVTLSDYGYEGFEGTHKGSPVEASFSHGGKYAWVSNYKMYGDRFNRPGTDTCSPSDNYDSSFLYRINTETLEKEEVIRVGSVPKFTAVSPDNRFVLVTNWCSYDMSIVDTETNKEIKRLSLGRYPRGIAIDPQSEKAYVAIMGSTDIAVVNLKGSKPFAVNRLRNIGGSPRHLNISPDGNHLYVSLNREGKIAKIDLSTNRVISKIETGDAPRSMVLSDDGEFLYVVNYKSHTVSRVRTKDMKVMQSVKTALRPIGITYDAGTNQVWVACYSGSLMVFQV